MHFLQFYWGYKTPKTIKSRNGETKRVIGASVTHNDVMFRRILFLEIFIKKYFWLDLNFLGIILKFLKNSINRNYISYILMGIKQYCS